MKHRLIRKFLIVVGVIVVVGIVIIITIMIRLLPYTTDTLDSKGCLCQVYKSRILLP